MAVMTTDMTTEGPVMWQAANPTIKNTAIDQNPARPVLKSLVTSGQVVCLTCLTSVSASWTTLSGPFFRNNLEVHSSLRWFCLRRRILLRAAKADTKCDVEICEDIFFAWKNMFLACQCMFAKLILNNLNLAPFSVKDSKVLFTSKNVQNGQKCGNFYAIKLIYFFSIKIEFCGSFCFVCAKIRWKRSKHVFFLSILAKIDSESN